MNSVTIFLLFYLGGSIEALTADCNYGLQYYFAAGISPNWESYYTCEFEIQNGNYYENPTKIQGQHTVANADNDIKYIYIGDKNKFKSFSSIYCQKFNNLKAISTFNVKFESVDENSLNECRNLLSLSFYGSTARTLPATLFIANRKLLQFEARQNNFEVLPENLFQNQQNLKNLDLSENLISNLPAKVFNSLTRLEVLDLDNNGFQVISPELFAGLQSLKWLDLDYNSISTVPPRAFVTLRGLENLYLNNNRIKTLSQNSFDGLQNLKEIELHTNQISELPINVFSSLRNLNTLNLKNNKLSIIHSDSFSYHRSLTHVSLQNNIINAIDEKFIDNLGIIDLNMENNICSQSWFGNKTNQKISEGLKKCFANYVPRDQDTTNRPTTLNLIQSGATSCGKAIAGKGNIVGGQYVARGVYPWVSALVLNNESYFCGGSLISSQKVVTAAHCMYGRNDEWDRVRLASDFSTLLGVYNLSRNIEIGRTPYAVQSINIHPDFNIQTDNFDADITVLVLARTVFFTELIQPICLIVPRSRIENINDGVVIGYGRSEDDTKVHETIPKILNTPIHKNEDCFLKNALLVGLSSKRTFCGGTGSGIGVCVGDSGGGLYMNDGQLSFLRGVVSSSLIGGKHGCDVDNYAVFTDVGQFVDWINGVTTSRFN